MAEQLDLLTGATRAIRSTSPTGSVCLTASPYSLVGNTGFGMPPIKRFSDESPLEDGATDWGYKLEPRKIGLSLMLAATSEATYWAQRGSVLSMFTLGDSAGTAPQALRYTVGTVVRQIDCYLSGGPDFESEGRFVNHNHRFTFELHCPDPLWYDPTIKSTALATGTAGWADPNYGTVQNTGNYRTYPTIAIKGPAGSAFILTNADLPGGGEKLSFEFGSVPAGGTLTANLAPRVKTLVDQGGTSRVSYLSADSDLATLCLDPGLNRWTLSGSAFTTAGTVTFSWYDLYPGI